MNANTDPAITAVNPISLISIVTNLHAKVCLIEAQQHRDSANISQILRLVKDIHCKDMSAAYGAPTISGLNQPLDRRLRAIEDDIWLLGRMEDGLYHRLALRSDRLERTISDCLDRLEQRMAKHLGAREERMRDFNLRWGDKCT